MERAAASNEITTSASAAETTDTMDAVKKTVSHYLLFLTCNYFLQIDDAKVLVNKMEEGASNTEDEYEMKLDKTSKHYA